MQQWKVQQWKAQQRKVQLGKVQLGKVQQMEPIIDLAAGLVHGPSRIEYSSSAALPKLAWVATLDSEQARLSVLHGRAVECRPSFMVEGVWDGPFEAGAFHNGAHLFGSGIRLDRGVVYFVPSAALVDRLVYCCDGGKLLVSNSVVALLAATGARLDPSHDYVIEARAMLAGVDGYDTAFHVLHPSIERFHQIYHKVLAVRDGAITLERTIAVREFDSFHDYCAKLRECLAAICANAKDPARRTPLMTFGTLSTGYDSTAVTALVKDLGVKRYFTYIGAWHSATNDMPEYETAPIAAALNIETIRIQSSRHPTRRTSCYCVQRARWASRCLCSRWQITSNATRRSQPSSRVFTATSFGTSMRPMK